LGSPPFDISIEDAVKQLINKKRDLLRNSTTKQTYKSNIDKLNNNIQQIYYAKSKQEIINLLNSAPSGTWKNRRV
jgi:hypothetical protein